jgi:hypothetical protein
MSGGAGPVSGARLDRNCVHSSAFSIQRFPSPIKGLRAVLGDSGKSDFSGSMPCKGIPAFMADRLVGSQQSVQRVLREHPRSLITYTYYTYNLLHSTYFVKTAAKEPLRTPEEIYSASDSGF